jgi:hypothetical protein
MGRHLRSLRGRGASAVGDLTPDRQRRPGRAAHRRWHVLSRSATRLAGFTGALIPERPVIHGPSRRALRRATTIPAAGETGLWRRRGPVPVMRSGRRAARRSRSQLDGQPNQGMTAILELGQDRRYVQRRHPPRSIAGRRFPLVWIPSSVRILRVCADSLRDASPGSLLGLDRAPRIKTRPTGSEDARFLSGAGRPSQTARSPGSTTSPQAGPGLAPQAAPRGRDARAVGSGDPVGKKWSSLTRDVPLASRERPSRRGWTM